MRPGTVPTSAHQPRRSPRSGPSCRAMTEKGGGGRDVSQDLRVPWDEDPGDLYEHAPCGYLTTLPDGTIVKVNETFLSWTGYDRSDLVGRRRFRDLLTAGGRIYHETHYAPLLTMQDGVSEIAF